MSSLQKRIQEARMSQSLNLREMGLSSLPDEILVLADSLQELLLTYNPLGVLPDWIGQFKKLKLLDVGKCKLKTLPAAILELREHLEEITYWGNEGFAPSLDNLCAKVFWADYPHLGSHLVWSHWYAPPARYYPEGSPAPEAGSAAPRVDHARWKQDTQAFFQLLAEGAQKEQQRLEQQRLEQQRLEQQRLEQQRLEERVLRLVEENEAALSRRLQLETELNDAQKLLESERQANNTHAKLLENEPPLVTLSRAAHRLDQLVMSATADSLVSADVASHLAVLRSLSLDPPTLQLLERGLDEPDSLLKICGAAEAALRTAQTAFEDAPATAIVSESDIDERDRLREAFITAMDRFLGALASTDLEYLLSVVHNVTATLPAAATADTSHNATLTAAATTDTSHNATLPAAATADTSHNATLPAAATTDIATLPAAVTGDDGTTSHNVSLSAMVHTAVTAVSQWSTAIDKRNNDITTACGKVGRLISDFGSLVAQRKSTAANDQHHCAASLELHSAIDAMRDTTWRFQMQNEFPSAAVQDAVHTVRGVAATLCARIAEIFDAQERYELLLKEVKRAQAQGPPETTTIDALNATVKKLRRRMGHAKVDLESEDDPAEQEILIQELAEFKKELQSTLGSLRREISRVVILAQGHFPEVLRRSTELAQFGSAMVGGELFAERPLDEYFQERILARKPHMVRLMSFDGELCVLKEFSVHALKTFVSEANRLRRLCHPHVVSVGVCFAHKDHVYMEMPFYAGGSLPTWLERLSGGGVEVPSACRRWIMRETLTAIEYVHSQGIIHCDVKPENVLMTSESEQARAVLADFDVSLDVSGRTMTMMMTVAAPASGPRGTMQFMAPELLSGTQEPTPAVDMYSFGVTLLWTMTGKTLSVQRTLPVLADSVSLMSVLQTLVTDDAAGRPTAALTLAADFFSTDVSQETIALEQQQSEAAVAAEQVAAEIRERQQALRQEQERVQRAAEEQAAREAELVLERESSKAEDDVARRTLQAHEAQVKESAARLRKEMLEVRKDREAVEKLQKSVKHLVSPPLHWTLATLEQPMMKEMAVSSEVRAGLERLLNETAEAGTHGLGRDSHSVRFRRFKVTRATRIENPLLWRTYALERQRVADQWKGKGQLQVTPAVRTDSVMWDGRQRLMQEAGEHYLFHGTSELFFEQIKQQGFEERVSNAGLFGRGCYFAEKSSKSDHYCRGQRLIIFVCRVVVGKPHTVYASNSNIVRPPCVKGHFDPHLCVDNRCDSVVAPSKREDARAMFLERFREFIVYDRHMAYPEYCVEYVRQ